MNNRLSHGCPTFPPLSHTVPARRIGLSAHCFFASWRLALAASTALWFATTTALAQRPPAPKLLPDRTIAYVRIHDTREFLAKHERTQIGRLLKDEKVRPFLEDLFASAKAIFEERELQEKVGASLEQLLALPQGELCVALVDPAVYGEGEQPVWIGVMEVGKNTTVAESILAKVVEQIESEDASKSEEAFGETMLTVLKRGDKTVLVSFLRDGTLVMASDLEAAKDIVLTWDGVSESRKLADNRKFVNIMRRSRGTKDERPQVAWYADPILFLRVAAKTNGQIRAALAFLPMLGLDGIKAVGGSMILDTEEFESLQHIHLMLDSPRRGVLKLLEFETGSGDPEPWVPADTSTYMSAYFDLPAAFAEIDRVLSRVRGEGALLRMAQQRVQGLGLDFEKDVLDQWGGRVTFLNWVESPDKVNHQASLLGIALRDPKQFRQTLQKVMENLGEGVKPARFRNVGYYRIETRQARIMRENNLRGPSYFRVPTPCVGIVGDSLVMTDSEPCLKAAITAMATGESLGKELDFKLIQSRIRTHLGTEQPSLIAFTRPEETLRGIYELLTSQEFRGRIEGREHPVARALARAMKDHPLPPYADIAKYFAPGGGVLVQDSAGLHYMAFGLKRQEP